MKRSRAFTLIELLVVVAIISILIAILIPSLAKAREIALRAKCAANLAAMGKSCVIYAASNNDQLPQFPGVAPTYWFHDIPVSLGDSLITVSPGFNSDNLQNSGLKQMFYCPARIGGGGSWSYTGTAATTQYRSTGYAWLVNRPAGNMPVLGGVRKTPLLAYRTNLIAVNEAPVKELALDDIISREGTGSAAGTWIADDSAGPQYGGSPNHMKGKVPAGANELYCDAHVDWKVMQVGNGVNPKNAVAVMDSGAANDFNWFINP